MTVEASDASTLGGDTARDLSLDPADWEGYRELAHEIVDACVDYLRTVRDRPVWRPVPAEVKAELSTAMPSEGQGASKAFADCMRLVLPYATGNVHPRFWGWVHGTGTLGGALAQLIAATMNSNVGGRDHGAVYVERQVIAWFRDLFGFPAAASGVLVSGTSMATLIALAVARGQCAPVDAHASGLTGVPFSRFYASEEAHASVTKAIELLGFAKSALTLIPSGDDYAMDVDALRAAIDRDLGNRLHPIAVVATAGTVATGAMDDLAAIAQVCAERHIWLHVDGAFGAAAKLAPSLAARLRGIERANSLAFDFHKWLHVPYEAGCVLVRDGEAHRKAFASHPSYLARAKRGLAGGDPWFCDFGLELSRSFRALPVWLTIKEHGAHRLGEKIVENCNQATYLAALVRERPELELCAPVSLNIVCFRFVSSGMQERDVDLLNGAIVADLQEAGVAAPSITCLRGRSAIRVAITNHRSTQADFDMLVERVVALGRARVA